MEIIVLQAFMTLINIVAALWMYNEKNYLTAIFNGFAAGCCFMALLNAINVLFSQISKKTPKKTPKFFKTKSNFQ